MSEQLMTGLDYYNACMSALDNPPTEEEFKAYHQYLEAIADPNTLGVYMSKKRRRHHPFGRTMEALHLCPYIDNGESILLATTNKQYIDGVVLVIEMALSCKLDVLFTDGRSEWGRPVAILDEINHTATYSWKEYKGIPGYYISKAFDIDNDWHPNETF